MPLQRQRIELRGLVQGLGFRPFVYRLAQEHGLAGWVLNRSEGVLIEAEGPSSVLASFIEALNSQRPPLSVLTEISTELLPCLGETHFQILPSPTNSTETEAWILPDLATCAACVQDLFEAGNRRFRYPFTNCTYCGPRYTIIQSLPYDRPRTSMQSFAMCPDCEAEYRDPGDRRFHAQPIACPSCGPQLSLWNPLGEVIAEREAALQASEKALQAGQILALKGLGGFQLLVDARNAEAVARLRTAKQREAKPLALMMQDLIQVKAYCQVSAEEAALLTGPQAPIVLLERLKKQNLAPNLTQTLNPRLGIMLPTTPLHHLLLKDLGFPLVATSGNLSDEPLCTEEQEALVRLQAIADLFLVHNRPILRPVDDSVVHVIAGQPTQLRRARGYAPLPLAVPAIQAPLLALGGHLKNTLALSRKGQVFLSQHLGDLDSPSSQNQYRHHLHTLPKLLGIEPEALACDTHPDYFSSQQAERIALPRIQVQHHLAHVQAVMAEHGLNAPLLGMAWDGLGLGTDQTLWGGEALELLPTGWQRKAWLRPFDFAGGEKALRKPAYIALGLLHSLWGEEIWERSELAPLQALKTSERKLLKQALASPELCQTTSSIGRLFDALASLLDLRQSCSFEGEAAIELEFLAQSWSGSAEPWPIPLQFSKDGWIANPEPLLIALLADLQLNLPKPLLAARFHASLVQLLLNLAQNSGLETVVLSGGCFQNRLLLTQAIQILQRAGFKVYWPQQVPANDGSLALGQILALHTKRKETAHVSGHSR
ncbi:carbamoyltransferase HypF [bacterium (Candidatus Blackallbacteria) CG17_big_fil_post_rev_8_21_14_2_50_48_46]|uniref:Carbamoyltransferase n=1 Tax=bacterium (Candidatus Blackallbacteria) CG17_big_fil_post_rev_8_21_14_2_50_48_46 TaxID=2014261 RepID=A0A2M7GBB4_9BACT|nr:MAG: carbamoyltransferase HypF [bacterium (Candidatus Blackallbacteria) CG18_big_fil_WC_8_21_14_2_50_49_26]PIW19482.1 MAG: carbamoyltransferase HypF [bacterium (Candidatus Blackallbacteria) CG17_big_fil_post_rev_8_21_14_2_50_48_46]PIW48914.1 MAG: carbamoyltransferase HypF [bacterium (Candidatus Blackallbacteria) CG13_big_fil_rev_8_21_14_2_50_49_14]